MVSRIRHDARVVLDSGFDRRRSAVQSDSHLQAFSFEAGHFWLAEMARLAEVCAGHIIIIIIITSTIYNWRRNTAMPLQGALQSTNSGICVAEQVGLKSSLK